ncbi:hypothetical protein JCM16358_20710 [Halanaerocella petrolearia]
MFNLENKNIYIFLAIAIILLSILLYPKFFATREVKVYFGDNQAQYLVAENREVKINNFYYNLMEELIKGPTSKGLIATIPDETKLLDLEVKDGLVKVDFSQEIVKNHPGGTAGETMTVYSIINTLTQFEEIDQVQILVAGQEVESLVGHIDLRHPLKFKGDLIQ